MDIGYPVLNLQQCLRGRTKDLVAPEIKIEKIGGWVDRAQTTVYVELISGKILFELA